MTKKKKKEKEKEQASCGWWPEQKTMKNIETSIF